MSTDTENFKKTPDSLVEYGKRRVKEIREFAKTKFGEALIQVSVNREDECFDVQVKDSVTDAEAKDFETLWPMTNVQKFKPIPRKK